MQPALTPTLLTTSADSAGLLFGQVQHHVSGPAEVFGGMLCCLLPILVLNVAGFVLWIWMIVDCATKEPSEGNNKVIWILVIVLTGWIGALIYYLVRRPERIRRYGQ